MSSSGLESNKIIAAILLASLITMLVGFVANILYKPNLKPDKRGYSIEISDNTEPAAEKEVAIVDIQALMSEANAEAGKEVSKKCISCHSFNKGEKAKVGPNLWNVAGATKADIEGYNFSPALIALGGAWDDESLFHFLTKPGKFVPGTKMSFIGLSNPKDVANIIAYLKTLKD